MRTRGVTSSAKPASRGRLPSQPPRRGTRARKECIREVWRAAHISRPRRDGLVLALHRMYLELPAVRGIPPPPGRGILNTSNPTPLYSVAGSRIKTSRNQYWSRRFCHSYTRDPSGVVSDAR
jgi:hypothetical protein